MAETRVRVMTPRQDERLGELVRDLEAKTQDPPVDPTLGWQPLLAKPKIGTQVYNTWLGNCNLMQGSGQRFQEIVRDQLIVDQGGAQAFEFLTRDLTREIKFINLTGVVITEDDFIVIVRVSVPQSGSWREQFDTYSHEGGMWAAINSVNQIHYGRTTGLVAAGGTGKALPLTETADDDGLGNVNVNLFSSHGDEDIGTTQEIIYARRGQDRLIIGAECEAPSSPIGSSPGYSSPTPADETTVVSTTVTLGWVGGSGADDLYFGQPGQVILIATNLTVNNFSFSGPLSENTVYEWIVRSVDPTSGEDILSPLWSFTTGPQSVVAVIMTASATMGVSLTGGAVVLACDMTASATMTVGLAGGRVEMQVDPMTASATMTVTLNSF